MSLNLINGGRMCDRQKVFPVDTFFAVGNSFGLLCMWVIVPASCFDGNNKGA